MAYKIKVMLKNEIDLIRSMGMKICDPCCFAAPSGCEKGSPCSIDPETKSLIIGLNKMPIGSNYIWVEEDDVQT